MLDVIAHKINDKIVSDLVVLTLIRLSANRLSQNKLQRLLRKIMRRRYSPNRLLQALLKFRVTAPFRRPSR